MSPSVLKVVASGGCGVTRDGTSFVVAGGVVITNAHVVAGETHVDVVVGATARPATIVVLDPSLDVALLRVPGLTAPAIRLHPAVVPTGTVGAVVGFPGGGPRTATARGGRRRPLRPRAVTSTAGSLVTRPIYAVTASVLPGNSGSPLVAGNAAIGMVFSRSLNQSDLAYAIRAVRARRRGRRRRHANQGRRLGRLRPGLGAT